MAMTQEEYDDLQAQLAAFQAGNPQAPQNMVPQGGVDPSTVVGGAAGLGALAYGGARTAQTAMLNGSLREMGVSPVPKMSITSLIPKTAANQDRRAAIEAGRSLVDGSKGARDTAKSNTAARDAALAGLETDMELERANITRNEAILANPKSTAAAKTDAQRARDAAQTALDDYEANGRHQIEADTRRRGGANADELSQLTKDYERASGAPARTRAQAALERERKIAGAKKTGKTILGTGIVLGAIPLVNWMIDTRARGGMDEGLSGAINIAKAGGQLSDEQVAMLQEALPQDAFESLLDTNGMAQEDPSIASEIDAAVEEAPVMPQDQDVNLDQLAAEAAMLESEGDTEGATAVYNKMTMLQSKQDAEAAAAAGGGQVTPSAAPAPMGGEAQIYNAAMNDGSVGPTRQNAAAQEAPAPMSDADAMDDLARRLYASGDIEKGQEIEARAQEMRAQENAGALDARYDGEIERAMGSMVNGFDNPVANGASQIGYNAMTGQRPFGEDSMLTGYADTLNGLDESLDVNIGDFLGEKGAPDWMRNLTNWSEDTGRGLALGAINPETYVQAPAEALRAGYKGARAMGFGEPDEQAAFSPEALAQQEREAAASAAGDAAFNTEGRGSMPITEDMQLGGAEMNPGGLTFQDLLNYRDQGILGGDPVQIAQDMGIDIPFSADGPYMPPVDTLDTLDDNTGLGGSNGEDMGNYMLRGNQPEQPWGQLIPQDPGVPSEQRQQYPQMDADQPMLPGMDEFGGSELMADGVYGGQMTPDMPSMYDAGDSMGEGDVYGENDNLNDPNNIPSIRKFLIEGDDTANPRGQDPIADGVGGTSGGFGGSGLNSGDLNPDRSYALAEPYQPNVDEFSRAIPTEGTMASGRGTGSVGPTTSERAPEGGNGPVGDFKGSKGLAEDAADAEQELNWINRQMRDRFGMDEDQRSDFSRALIAGGATLANAPGSFLQGFTQAGVSGMEAYDAAGDKRNAALSASEQKEYDRLQDSLDRQRQQREDQRVAANDARDASMDGLRLAKLQAEIGAASVGGKPPEKSVMMDILTEDFMVENGGDYIKARESARKVVYNEDAMDALLGNLMANAGE